MNFSAALVSRFSNYKKILVIILIPLLLLIIMAVTAYFLIRIYLPLKPSFPYFPNIKDKIGGVHWDLGHFQPVFLYSFKSNNNYFIKVAYRDSQMKIRTMNVLVGRTDSNGTFISRLIVSETEGVDVQNIKDYGKYFKLGDRVNITYLKSVLQNENDNLVVVPPNIKNTTDLCNLSKTFCISIDLIQTYPDAFGNFDTTKSFSKNILFPAIWVGKVLNK